MSSSHATGKIQLLPGDVISRIAAGEVIERPAAVVKELLDNSLDAGSSKITIEIQDGGLTLIRVLDDGEGMSAADASLAFHRHATSKVRSDGDLSTVRSMGFRGEALPSIASVSKTTLVTFDGTGEVGTRLSLSGGEIQVQEETVFPQGTSVEVRDLFFNTPARKKFLKTPVTEFSHISHAVQQASLAWPDIQFHLRHNGNDVFRFPAVSNQRDRVLQVYQQRFLDQCLDIQGTGPGFSFSGIIVNPLQARTGRTPQDIFINRRPVKNGTISHAMYEGYDSFLPKGRHPRFVLFFEMDPAQVDVNVHPTKREVRFLNQEPIHREVRRAVRIVLGSPPESQSASAALAGVSVNDPLHEQKRGTPSLVQASERMPWSVASATAQPIAGMYVSESASESMQEVTEQPLPLEVDSEPLVFPLGQINRTFLVVQVGTELQVVDQHTAHERVIFERLRRDWEAKQLRSQPLLIPDPVELPPHAASLLQQYIPDLEQLGLVIEPFGQASFIIRAVPASLGQFDYAPFVQDLLEDLEEWNSLPTWESKVRPLLATFACHSAVRAGRKMDGPEIKQLVEDWVREGLPMTCPHGRRTALRLPADDLAKIFGRS